MKRAVQLALFILAIAFLIPAAQAQAQKTRFTATLSGADQVPAVQSAAHGTATFRVSPSGKSILYTVSVTGIDDPMMAHIHAGAAGTNGPPVVTLYPTKAHPMKMGKVSGVLSSGVITAAQLTGPMKGKTIADLVGAMQSGDTYVNVHTQAHMGGELRGQIQ